MHYSSFFFQLAVDKTTPFGEKRVNKAPFGPYKSFFMIKPEEINCADQ